MRVKNVKTYKLVKGQLGRPQLCLPQIIISDGDNYVIELSERDIEGLVGMIKEYKKENIPEDITVCPKCSYIDCMCAGVIY